MSDAGLPAGFDLVEEEVAVGPYVLRVVRPRSAETLIDEALFALDERLPYWAEVWPSGRVLAEALLAAPLDGRRVLELGAGLGVPSIVAALRGASVLATDWYEEALAFCRANVARAGVAVDTLLVDWFDPPAEPFAAEPFDLVIGADVLYEPRHATPLAELIRRLVAPGGAAWIADPRRPDAAPLLRTMADWGWRVATEEVRNPGRIDESGPVIRLHRLRPGR